MQSSSQPRPGNRWRASRSAARRCSRGARQGAGPSGRGGNRQVPCSIKSSTEGTAFGSSGAGGPTAGHPPVDPARNSGRVVGCHLLPSIAATERDVTRCRLSLEARALLCAGWAGHKGPGRRMAPRGLSAPMARRARGRRRQRRADAVAEARTGPGSRGTRR
jgi:hypothetical protein